MQEIVQLMLLLEKRSNLMKWILLNVLNVVFGLKVVLGIAVVAGANQVRAIIPGAKTRKVGVPSICVE